MDRLVVGIASIAAAVSLGAAWPSKADPLNTMDEVGAALGTCWNAPAGAKESFVTLSLSFRRDGTLIGPPRPTGINVARDEQARQRFVDAAIAAVGRCVPLTFSPKLAEGIGGQIFTVQFAGSGIKLQPQGF